MPGVFRPPGIRPPWLVQWHVLRALFLREVSVRLFAKRLAWLWLFLEPVAHIAFLILIFSTLRQREISGIDFGLFLAIGVVGFQMFRVTAQRPAGAIEANRALFNYRQVRPVDTVIVRIFLEGLLQLLVVGILLACAAFVGLDILPHDPLLMLLTLLALWLLGTGFGLALSVMSGLVPEMQKVVNMLFQPLYFLSGIFYRPEIAPPAVRDILLLNPVMHGIELMRAATFRAYHAYPTVSLAYVVAWGLFLVLIGLALQVRYARRLASL